MAKWVMTFVPGGISIIWYGRQGLEMSCGVRDGSIQQAHDWILGNEGTKRDDTIIFPEGMTSPLDRSPLPPLPPKPEHYPYVVVRIFSALYEKYEIHFDPSAVLFVLDHDEQRWIIPTTDLDPRQAAIAAVRDQVTATGHRMCAVFGPKDCIYIEPDGSNVVSVRPPSGGLSSAQLDNMMAGPQQVN
jgi:hypothetical protein